MCDTDYKDGWRYIVWVGGNDDYYKNYEDAKRDADEWQDKGYDDVILSKINEDGTEEIIEDKASIQDGIANLAEDAYKG